MPRLTRSHAHRLPALCRPLAYGLLSVLLLSQTIPASAHFIWLAPPSEFSIAPDSDAEPDVPRVQIHFSEDAYPDNPELLDRLSDLTVSRLSPEQPPETLRPVREGDSLVVKLERNAKAALNESIFIATKTMGVRDRGEGPFLLKYYAKGGPIGNAPVWQQMETSKHLPFDVRHELASGQVDLQVQFKGNNSPETEFHISGPQGQNWEIAGDEKGRASFTPKAPGRYSIWVRHIEAATGKHDAQAYESIRHYLTLTLDLNQEALPEGTPSDKPDVLSHQHLAPLPMTLTSFGGAVIGDHAYIYGGTMGGSHSYSVQDQNNTLYRLSLRGDGGWEKVAEGPRLQGLSMEPYDGKLIRIGGFAARNQQGEDHDLVSQDDVAMLDPHAEQPRWVDLPPLPEPRSSFDSAVLGSTLYVIGGWSMAGRNGERDWHETAWAMDLAAESPTWKRIADPPTRRRAIAVAAHAGKLYSIGGISEDGDTTLATEVYDPSTDRWEQGPELVGDDPIAGFGASAFATGDSLYISTVTETLQRLSNDGSQWEVVGQTPTKRFFHRMLPIDSQRFVVVGGSNRGGRVQEVEVYAVPHSHSRSHRDFRPTRTSPP